MPSRLRFRPLDGVWLHDTRDALVVVQAVRDGLLPALDRRLTRDESINLVKSGHLFIFHEGESGIKRWTDSYKWTDSRIKHNYLIYAQKESNANERGAAEMPAPLYTQTGKQLSTKDIRSLLECIAGPLRKITGINPDLLLKRTITIIIGPGDVYHLVSYYTYRDVLSGSLIPAHLHPWLHSVEPSREGMVHSTGLRFMPTGEKRPGDSGNDLPTYAGETGRACRVCALSIVQHGQDGERALPPTLGPLMPEPDPQTTSLLPSHHGSEVTPSYGGATLVPDVSAPCPITAMYTANPGAAGQTPFDAQLDPGPNILGWSQVVGGVESDLCAYWGAPAPSWQDAGEFPTAAVVLGYDGRDPYPNAVVHRDDSRYPYPNTGFALQLRRQVRGGS
ncbi:hypothetical protein CALVIDRAFT_601621 [Calocera viscosa TUFC12733]|uniref:Gti1/Pac2 family-domain-containing protein n=1 Tax=Calocera viscosa (strain TUFC12733) TaxID=1330018 RepID=A0A167I433_CALVF|nr:hypothetical protein CALVIDRAFT_601621 [Calocera viscosa TUFC12733]